MSDPMHRTQARPVVPSSWLDEPIEVRDLDPTLDLDAFGAESTTSPPAWPAELPPPAIAEGLSPDPDRPRAAPAPDALAQLLRHVGDNENRAEPVREAIARKIAVFRHRASVAAPSLAWSSTAHVDDDAFKAARRARETREERARTPARRREVPPMVTAAAILILGLGTAAYIVSRPLPSVVASSDRAPAPAANADARLPEAVAAPLVRTAPTPSAGGGTRPVAARTARRGATDAGSVTTVGRASPASIRRTSGALVPRLREVPALPPPPSPPRDANGAPAGWLRIEAPGDFQLTVDGVSMGPLGQSHLIAAGTHDVVLASERAGVRTTARVTVQPGQLLTVPVRLPEGVLSVTAQPAAEVLVDGRSIGTTPISRLALAAGVRRVIVRTAELGERSYEVVVRDGRLTELSVDLRR